jgi:hypothetical protein
LALDLGTALSVVLLTLPYMVIAKLGGWPEGWYRITRKPYFVEFILEPDMSITRRVHLQKMIQTNSLPQYSFQNKTRFIDRTNTIRSRGRFGGFYHSDDSIPIPVVTYPQRGEVDAFKVDTFLKNDSIERLQGKAVPKPTRIARQGPWLLIGLILVLTLFLLMLTYNIYQAVHPHPGLAIIPGFLLEFMGDNRAGKTETASIWGWLEFNTVECPKCFQQYLIPFWADVTQVRCLCNQSYLVRKTIYINCPTDRRGEIHHIMNIPHKDIDLWNYEELDLWNVFLLTDELDKAFDARMSMKDEVKLGSYFGYQARKREVNWGWTTVRHGDIEIRVRQNPDYVVKVKRIPEDYNLPLQAIKLRLIPRYGDRIKTIWVPEPHRFFAIYNHKVIIEQPIERTKIESNITTKQLATAILRQ